MTPTAATGARFADALPSNASWEPSPLLAVLAGVVVGGSVAYLCVTSEGRRALERAESWLDDVLEQMNRLQRTVAKAQTTLEEGRRAYRRAVDPT